jgi:chloramphenicol-sensitive protein RarD
MAAAKIPEKTVQKNEDTLGGFFYALTAYLLWGFLPLYMKAVAHIPAYEVVAHRVLWSLPIAGAVLLYRRRMGDIVAALRNPRMLLMAATTAAFVSINWMIYVYSISAGRALESALGYYINPLFSIALGSLLLKESLSRAQMAAIGLAVVAVGILTWDAGGLPWISIGLAVSWGIYAFLRKTLPVGPNQGFFLEVAILSPFALAVVVWVEATGHGHFTDTGWSDVLLLMASGLVTAVPLMIYANGAKLLTLSTIGIMQYIAPTMIFITAIFLFHEPFSLVKLAAFGLIWIGLAIYSLSMYRNRRR